MRTNWHQNCILNQLYAKGPCRLKTIIIVVLEAFFTCSTYRRIFIKSMKIGHKIRSKLKGHQEAPGCAGQPQA